MSAPGTAQDSATGRFVRSADGHATGPGAPTTTPSERRAAEERERRHRERAIAGWLRSLVRDA